MRGWNGTSLQRTWLRKQGRGAGRVSRATIYGTAGWQCAGCNREHRPETDRVRALDGLDYCWRQFAKLPGTVGEQK